MASRPSAPNAVHLQTGKSPTLDSPRTSAKTPFFMFINGSGKVVLEQSNRGNYRQKDLYVYVKIFPYLWPAN